MKGARRRLIRLMSTSSLALLLATAVILPAQAQPVTQGPNSPGTAVNDASIGTSAWTINPSTAVQSSDNVYAISALSGGAATNYLKVTNFGFAIPGSAVIGGLEVAVEKAQIGSVATDNAVRIVKGGTIGATDRSSPAGWPATDTVVTYGGSSDLWGESWTAGDINGSGFGFAISAKDSGLATMAVDHITITVYYSLCGDSIISPGEQCDDGNTSNGDCCSSTCQIEANTVVCRPAQGGCDLAENCTGSSSSCPTDAVKDNGVVCRAATTGGDCDEVEVCDGVSTACPDDGFLSAATVCRAAAGECDLAENCPGDGPLCPSDDKKPSGTGCIDDGNVCTLDECDGSNVTCQHPAVPDDTDCADGEFCNGAETCQGGTCQSAGAACPLLCDEETDQCLTGCPPAPAACRGALKSILAAKDTPDDTKDRLIWRWIRGGATTLAEFEDPIATADYTLCIYAGAAELLVGEAIVPASPTKWRVGGTSKYIYTDAAADENGIKKVVLKSGAAQKAKAIVKGKGTKLPDLTLPVADPVTVQLANGDNGLCWGATYAGSQLLRNQPGLLKAKAP